MVHIWRSVYYTVCWLEVHSPPRVSPTGRQSTFGGKYENGNGEREKNLEKRDERGKINGKIDPKKVKCVQKGPLDCRDMSCLTLVSLHLSQDCHIWRSESPWSPSIYAKIAMMMSCLSLVSLHLCQNCHNGVLSLTGLSPPLSRLP